MYRYRANHAVPGTPAIEDGIIYFETDKYKSFKKIMKAGKNGIAVDVVQKKQYQ